MKLSLLIGGLVLVSSNCFASSVCIVTTGSVMGEETSVTCDGKDILDFNTDKGFDEALTINFKKLIDKGYKLQGTTVAGQDPVRSFIFIKE